MRGPLRALRTQPRSTCVPVGEGVCVAREDGAAALGTVAVVVIGDDAGRSSWLEATALKGSFAASSRASRSDCERLCDGFMAGKDRLRSSSELEDSTKLRYFVRTILSVSFSLLMKMMLGEFDDTGVTGRPSLAAGGWSVWS
jgi:hypothetical protein